VVEGLGEPHQGEAEQVEERQRREAWGWYVERCVGDEWNGIGVGLGGTCIMVSVFELTCRSLKRSPKHLMNRQVQATSMISKVVDRPM
jgi:hypothetical protein